MANLNEVFADEIAQYDNVLAWVKARQDAGNLEGIHVGDILKLSNEMSATVVSIIEPEV